MSNSPEINRLEDRPPQASSDEVIARLVVDELYWDSRVDASKVQVEVTDGVVTLMGHVPTVADRYSAEADARMIHGIVTVNNQIRVDVPRIFPDAELGSDVTAVLTWAPDLDNSDVDVSVVEGTVTLRGTVPNYWQKLRAHLLATQVKGVVNVVDELAVVPTHSLSDQQMSKMAPSL
jgi:osmotically-inducible protein OsmY